MEEGPHTFTSPHISGIRIGQGDEIPTKLRLVPNLLCLTHLYLTRWRHRLTKNRPVNHSYNNPTDDIQTKELYIVVMVEEDIAAFAKVSAVDKESYIEQLVAVEE